MSQSKIAANFSISPEMVSLLSSIMERVGSFKTHGTYQSLVSSSPAPKLPDPYDPLPYGESIGREVKANVKKIFLWAKRQKEKIHPLFLAPIFAYELGELTPLKEEEWPLAMTYMKALLREYRPLFAYLPFEKKALRKKEAYRAAIVSSGESGDIAPYITYMLQAIDEALKDAQKKQTGFEGRKSPCVEKLLSVMEPHHEYTSKQLMERLGLKSRVAVKRNYLEPAMKGGYVKMLLPGKPHSPNQRYYRQK